jgi:hypothetical protein
MVGKTGTAEKSVYLRNIPSAVVREAKAEAARRGVTLAGFVTEALTRALNGQSPLSEQDHDLDEELRWYERNRERLVPDFEGQFVAIVDRTVIDHDKDFDALARRVLVKHGVRNVFMPRVSADENVVRVRSPRIKRR